MLAIEITRQGGPEVLTATEKPLPSPKEGEILVRHAAIGLNFLETYQRSGLYPIALPAVLGSEAAGVVEAVGPGVTRFVPGERVAYATAPMGAYAEAHCVPETKAVRVPDSIPLETAAAGLLKGMTAEFLLRRCYPVRPGETILITAAAGGVGQILVQWAKALGATVIAAAGGPEKLAVAKALGADHLIDYRLEDMGRRVREITGGEGVRAAYDSVGAATFEGTFASIGRRGWFICFGNASGPAPPVEPLRLSRAGSLIFTRPGLFDYVATAEELDASAEALFDVMASGSVKIAIGQTFPLTEARAAHEALEARRTLGSSLLIP